jgi:hypothetical protein
MQAVEFTIDLSDKPVVKIPADVAAQLPATGRARIIILTSDEDADSQWQRAAYEQFARDDAPEDSVYDSLR